MFLTRETYATLFGATQQDSSHSKIATIFHDSIYLTAILWLMIASIAKPKKSGENVKFAE